ncbi:MAG: permease-like cell division protein FtsX [Clostridia bacterium]|nr:permease-like cell division protein FtsX [Clostridia bacterium]
MKLRSVRYLTANGLKNIWVNRLMSIASVGVLVACMSIIGVAVMITKNVDKALTEIEKENVVMVYFNDKNSVLYGESTMDTASGSSADADNADADVPDSAYLIHNEEEALALCEKLEQLDNVESVEYVSKEQALETVKSNLLENQKEYFEFIDDENPMSDGAKVVLKSLETFDETVEMIKKTEGVDSVQSQENVADTVYAIKNALKIAGFWIIGILIIISLVIVSNTIRVTMYNRKLEINIMKAVGATDSFIRIPFLVEGVAIGIISALVSMGLVYFLYKAVVETLKNVLNIGSVVPFNSFVWELLILFVVVGVFAGIFGSIFVITKYLKKEGSEFRAI